MEYLIHAANVIYLVSYLVRDILWLRVLTVIAALTLCGYFYVQALVPPIAWNVLFIGINIYHIRRLLLERRPVALSEREQRLHQLVFRALTPREFQRLIAEGEWKTVPAGEELVGQGETLEHMMVLYSGRAEVASKGAPIAQLERGCFVGEISFITGQATTASVTAREETTYVAWPMERLRAFLRDNHELRAAWQFVIGTDLATKLRAA